MGSTGLLASSYNTDHILPTFNEFFYVTIFRKLNPFNPLENVLNSYYTFISSKSERIIPYFTVLQRVPQYFDYMYIE